MPEADDLVEIAIEAAGVARRLGYKPRVALLAYSTFGNPHGRALGEGARGGGDARRDGVDFEYEGEMPPTWRWSRSAAATIRSCA